MAGVVCAGTRFEGMLWGATTKDGMTATDEIMRLIRTSKFVDQVHLILLDGLTFGGCNVIDLPKLSQAVELPVVAVMRRQPDMDRFKLVVDSMPHADERWRRVLAAGKIHDLDGWVFQVCGEQPQTVARALACLTDQGKVPEALRLAHLIGGAVMRGESGRRA